MFESFCLSTCLSMLFCLNCVQQKHRDSPGSVWLTDGQLTISNKYTVPTVSVNCQLVTIY